jgi:hypothetical protein
MALADDLSIPDNIGILRGLKPTEIERDSRGVEIPARAAFRSYCLSAFREDRATAADVFAEYLKATRIARFTVRDIRAANCIIQNEEPPKGHVGIYRKDNPGQRISGGSAGTIARSATLTSDRR